ncbi:MAG: permease-like cell division protein FtsX [Duncaniella sp.]|nr:permease-like cell division protein FtsX [Duncaniella sp.]
MPKKLRLRIPIFSTRATATLSVALVLVILGLASLVGIGAHRATESVKQNMGFVIVLADDATATDIEAVSQRLKSTGGIAEVSFSSSDDILDRWQKIVGEDEDILALAGINPFSPELEVRVASSHAYPDSIVVLTAPLELMPAVREVRVTADIIETVRHTMDSITLVLLIVAGALMLVSFVLIFNTVRLTVYSRRFVIHTMQLVGATPGFIRKPFLLENLLSGAVAGIIASIAVGATIYGASSIDRNISDAVFPADILAVCGGMFVTGMVICFAASWFACNRYLSLSYDQLFK